MNLVETQGLKKTGHWIVPRRKNYVNEVYSSVMVPKNSGRWKSGFGVSIGDHER